MDVSSLEVSLVEWVDSANQAHTKVQHAGRDAQPQNGHSSL
jgi:hypothetical protein